MTGRIHCPCHCQLTDSSPSPRGCHPNDMKRRRRIRRPRQTHASHRLVRKSVVLSLFLLLALSTAASFQQQFSSKPAATSTCASTCNGPTANVLIRQRGGGSDLPESSSTPLSPTATKSSLKPPTKDRTVPSFGIIDDNAHEEYHRRKEEWADRYTTIEGLRFAFGRNKNRVWGDLDATTSRRLYKSLLPNALCELVLELGMRPEDLAPLAYQARKAAKLYARERCHLPARIAAQLFDGYRQWKTYGRFQVSGMSYDQIWDKYRSMILHEVVTTKKKKTSGRRTIQTNDTNAKDSVDDDEVEEEEHDPDEEWTEEDIVIQTCLKILERSCTTNERIDRMLLSSSTTPDTTETTKTTTTNDTTSESPSQELARRQLMKVAKTLEDDVRKLLDPAGFEDTPSSVKNSNTIGEGYESSKLQLERPPETLTTTTETRTMTTMTGRQYKALKRFALARRRNILQALESDVLIPPRIWNSTILTI